MSPIMNPGNTFVQDVTSGCAPVTCPVCGGLECLCRPRFFAGQLLTDEDLKRLDHYITAKNKLHNRYLIGWGVACGLEVVCNSCDGTVTVRPGYALSPCGEDIVVCADTPVDVCSMIQKCRKTQPRDCQPFQTGGNDPCKDATEEWVLSICYDEKLSRGVVPLKNTGSAACCSRCACGGSSSCGRQGQSSGGSCSCGGSNSGKSNGCACGATSTQKSASTQAQCEPTVVCEGYRFEVCKITKKPAANRARLGAMVQRFWCCLLKLGELIAKIPTSDDPKVVQGWCCALRENLLEFTAENPGYDCALAQRLAQMCQSKDGINIQQIGNDVGRLVVEYFQYCFCSAILPPCPPPSADDCVPLATVTINKKNGGCNITRVCNIDVRKFLVDMPNLGYWLSWIPFGAGLRRLFSTLCCKPLAWERAEFRTADRAIGVTDARAAGSVDAIGASNPAADFLDLVLESFKTSERKVDMQALTMAALGMSDVQGTHNLNELELKYPLESLMLNQVARPLVQSYLGVQGGIGNLTGARSVGQAFVQTPTPQAQPPVPAQDAQTQLNELKTQVEKLQGQIDKLNKGTKG